MKFAWKPPGWGKPKVNAIYWIISWTVGFPLGLLVLPQLLRPFGLLRPGSQTSMAIGEVILMFYISIALYILVGPFLPTIIRPVRKLAWMRDSLFGRILLFSVFYFLLFVSCLSPWIFT